MQAYHQDGDGRVVGSKLITSQQPFDPSCHTNKIIFQPQRAFNDKNVARYTLKILE